MTKYRAPAFLCALSVLFCELISRPYAAMGIGDDGPYILVAKNLAATGHIHYNGWSAAMLCWQLYLGAALIKIFGFSFTTVRLSTMVVSVASAFFLQRILVRCGISERNAVIGTLALVLSPLYLLLSVTFMSDIHGLFGIIICLYACLRALQASNDRVSINWLCFAVAANVLVGTSRQLAWLGVLVMIPSTLWLLRTRRRVLIAGAAATIAGFLAIGGCLIWLSHQPYTTPGTYGVSRVPWRYIIAQFTGFFLEFPFLLLPVSALFLLSIRNRRPRTIVAICGLLGAFFFLAVYPSHLRGHFSSLLQPTLRDYPGCDFITIHGAYESLSHGTPHLFLPLWIQGLLSVVSFGGMIGLICSFFAPRRVQQLAPEAVSTSWKQLGTLLGPFAAAYIFILIYRAAAVANDHTGVLFDRYSLGLLLVVLICLVRQLQDRVQPRFSLVSIVFIAVIAAYGVAITHNTFALYRARVAMAAELRDARIPETSVDNGWEYNLVVELRHTPYINNPSIATAANPYVPPAPVPDGTCTMFHRGDTPHVQPVYGVSFEPNVCAGPAPFAPVHYSRWLASEPGTLYVVRYTPSSKP
ncbi:MAG: glycosyltransferase family 39 protein [Acidobacteriaceae bacterium]